MTGARIRPADSLLTADEVAAHFGVCVATVWGWVRLGRLRAIRTPGNHMRFTHEALHEARNRGPDGDTDGGDAAARPPDREPPEPDGAPAPRWGGCGFPLPDDYRTRGGWCYCGATYAMHA